MRLFIKWNGWSLFFALILFLPVEMTLNIERIIRITGTSYQFFYLIDGLLILVCTILFFTPIRLIRGITIRNRLIWSTSFSWIPYFFFMSYALSQWFPVTYPTDFPSPVLGLLLIGVLAIYPFCILILISFLKEKAKSDGTSSVK